MFKWSKEFYECFKNLYEANSGNLYIEKDFDEIFKNNESRMKYIISLFDDLEKNNLSLAGRQVFEDTIEYIVEFINGNKKGRNIKVPDNYFKDESVGAIIPTMDEFELLLKMVQNNKIIFDTFYRDNSLILELPDMSFNQNMIRILKIENHNLAHLLGLTEYEDPLNPNPTKNLLKKYINANVENKNLYGARDAEIVLNWVTSYEGKQQLKLIHQITLDFVENDRISNPNSYDAEGNLKPNSNTIMKFKERYKKETGLDYPIINFSRIMVKAINTHNFLNLKNVVEMILDYNAPKGKTNEKDVFLVSAKSKEILNKNNRFTDMRTDLIIDICRYAHNQDDLKLKQKLIDNGIDVNKEEIKNQINIILASQFLEQYGIKLDDSILNEKIIESLNTYFDRNVHLLGFNTEFNSELEIPLENFTVNTAHCDTSIVITIPELIGDYYIRGRPFFIDKIRSEDEVIMVSNVRDEMNYLASVLYLKEEAYEQLDNLKNLKNLLKEKYSEYLKKHEGPQKR